MNRIINFQRPVLDLQATGRNLPTVDNLIVLSELFGVTIDEIVCLQRALRAAFEPAEGVAENGSTLAYGRL